MGKRTVAEDGITENGYVGESYSGEETVIASEPYYVYIGPSVRGVVHHGHIFHCTHSEAVTSLGKYAVKIPEVRGLIVDGNDLMNSLKKLKTEGSALNLINKKVVKALAK